MGKRNQLYLSDTEDAILGGFVRCYGENVQAVSAHHREVHLGIRPDVGVQGLNLTHYGAKLAQLGNAELIRTLEEEVDHMPQLLLYSMCSYFRMYSHTGISEKFNKTWTNQCLFILFL